MVAYDNLAKHEFARNPYMRDAARDYNRRELQRMGARSGGGRHPRRRRAHRLCAGTADYICHTAAQPAMTISWEDPELDFSTNTRGTFNVLEAARARRDSGRRLLEHPHVRPRRHQRLAHRGRDALPPRPGRDRRR